MALDGSRQDERGGRLLLLVSLALNLFLIGAGGTLAARYYLASPPAAPVVDHSAAGRIDRIAATLPDSDATILRQAYRANDSEVEVAQRNYRQAQDAARATLRAEPFDVARLRSAMADIRAMRQKFDEALQKLIAQAAAQMSPAGRNKLADWPPHRQTATPKTR
ncbi:MAG: periplasmic heavy metal sensor [Variibacter sp.]